MAKLIGSKNSLKTSGFTLIELLIAAAMGVIITGVAIGGLINAQEASRKSDQKLEQQAELQRALNYIATDIQEGQQVSIDQTRSDVQDPPYKLVFYILRANPNNVSVPGRIGYYIKAKDSSVEWRGPLILYRKRWPSIEEVPSSPGVDNNQKALIDAIALEPIDNPKCKLNTASGLVDPLKFDIFQPTLSRGKKAGMSIVIPKGAAPGRAVICLRGTQAKAGGKTGLDVSVDASVRIRPTPP
jgi:type II secretory pathway pseudopilin PulG